VLGSCAQLTLVVCHVQTREVVTAHQIIRTAELFSFMEDHNNHHEEVLEATGKATSLYWFVLPGGVALAKLQELLSQAVPWDYVSLERLHRRLFKDSDDRADLYGLTSDAELLCASPLMARLLRWGINFGLFIGIVGTVYGSVVCCGMVGIFAAMDVAAAVLVDLYAVAAHDEL